MDLKVIVKNILDETTEVILCDYVENEYGIIQCKCRGQEKPVKILPIESIYRIQWNREV